MIDKSRDPAVASVPMELDHNLRLHAQRLELGKAELLTDTLTLPFTDIESRLTRFVIGSSAEESEQLRKSIKHYLGRLNANHLIPLTFRMKVLKRFEQELDLFDGDMTAAVLNSHKIAVEMVQQAAINNASYYPVLIDMVSSAIELALKLLHISLQRHQGPAIIAIRQFFELAKLGLGLSTALDHTNQQKVERLHTAICKFELLRLLDFYGKTEEEQRLTWNELQHHIGSLHAHLCRRNENHESFSNKIFLVSNLHRPNDAAKVLQQLPDQFDFDCILIPVDMLIDRVTTAIEHVQSILNSHNPHKELHTEVAMSTTLVGGKAILKALKNNPRQSIRHESHQGLFALELDSTKAFRQFSQLRKGYHSSINTPEHQDGWQIIDISQHGTCIERLHARDFTDHVGKIIGLSFTGIDLEEQDNSLPPLLKKLGHAHFKLGFVRWAREIKPGEHRLGIEFLQGRMQTLEAMMLNGHEDTELNHSWPVIITAAGKNSYSALFPNSRTYRNMTFSITKETRRAHYIIKQVLIKGENYSLCEISPAKDKGPSDT